MDALNNESNVVSAERSNIDVTCSQGKGKAKRPKRVHNKTRVKIEIPLDDILQNSKKSMKVAADNLQVSQSTLKRVCRRYGFSRWPPRNKNKVGSSQPSESSPGVDHQQILQLSSNQPFSQALAVVVHANPHNTVIRDANIVTVKAKYINDIIIKFSLSLSSGLVELQQQIANRLHLEDGTYYVKYKDEDDNLTVIACDQDLQDYISSSKSLGSTTIMEGLVELQQQIAKRLNVEAGSYYVKYKDEEDHMILIACDDDLQDCISTYRLLGTSIVEHPEWKIKNGFVIFQKAKESAPCKEIPFLQLINQALSYARELERIV
ncbi:unnamed protein product [Camellia sinensis]